MDFSGETNNKDCTMNSLPMLVSLIETAIKEKTIDKMYGDFLEEAVKMGLSSYTLNVLIINAKKRIENGNTDSNDDIIIPFVYRSDIIKPKPEIKYIYKTQEKIVIRNKKGYGFIMSLIIVLLLNVVIIALFCQNTTEDLINTSNSLSSIERKVEKVNAITQIGSTPIHSFKSWTSTNKEHNTKSNKDYSFTIKKGDKFSFDYNVSSESGYDKLNVYLYTHSDTTKLLTKSGVESGTKTHTFNNGGDVVVRFEYSKDGSYHRNNDVVKVSNINVYKPYNIQINEIKELLSLD